MSRSHQDSIEREEHKLEALENLMLEGGITKVSYTTLKASYTSSLERYKKWQEEDLGE